MKRLICCLMMLMLALPFYPAGAEEKKSTTVMVYMCGSNLESQYGLATRDIAEMMGSGLDRFSTNVVIMTGGASSWAFPSLPSDQVGIHQIRGNSLYTLWQGEQRSMGEGETLALLLNTAYEKFHTDRYVLILWNHGGGPIQGVCWDENFDKDSLQIPELIAGIEKSPFKERKLDLIGFDACLMGSVETAWQLSDYAELMIASEETEPGGGWDYSFLGGMEKEEITATGRRIIDLYVDTAHQAQGAHLTLSMIDLSKVEGVVEGMDAYFSGLGRSMNENGFQDLSNLRYYAQGFGRDWRAAESTDYDLVDITSLLDAYEDYQPAAADDLRAALQDAIVYHRGTYSESFGLSAYFPYFNGQAYLEKGKAAYEKLNFCPGYTEFIDLFYRRMHAPGQVDWRGLMPSVTREEEGFQISLQLTQAQKEHLVSARLVVFESNFAPGSANAYYDPVYASADTALSAEGLLSAPYRDERLILQFATENGMSRQAESLPFTVLDTGEYQVEFLASNLIPEFGAEGDRDEPGVSHLMQAILSPPDEGGKLQIRQIRAWDSMTNTFTSRMDDQIENYQYLHFISHLAMITRQDDLILPYWQWRKETSYHPGFIKLSYAMARSEWSFEMQRQPADIQFAAFEITDIYNRTFTTELVPVRPVEEMILYKKRFSLPNPRIDINCYLVACSTYQANLIVELINHTDQTYSFAITDQLLNGKENYRAPDHPSLSQWVIGPGEKGSTFIKYGPEHSYLNEISLSLSLYAGEGGAYLGSTGYLSLKPGMAITQLQERFR